MIGVTLPPSDSVNHVLPKLRINSERLRADFDRLSLIGATASGGINRLALSPEDLQARAWLADRIDDAGLMVRDDDAGNLSGVLLSDKRDAPTLLIGSHLDSVPNGGRYDGSIGVLAGLECLRVIKEQGIRLPLHLEVINFTDDEGNWSSLFGVRALTGSLRPDDLNDARTDNAPFRAALNRAGIDPREVFRARREPRSLAGYLELHIEHGTRLQNAGKPVGVVTGIVSRATHQIVFYGQAGHSGTSDMYRRRDALRGAALFIVRTHDLIRERYGDGIFNCGDIEVKPGAFNIIPSEARLTVECRHVSEAIMAEMETAMLSIARECAASYALTVETRKTANMPAAQMSAGFVSLIEQSCAVIGVEPLHMISYAGHAAQFLGNFIPSGMIFIPSKDGIGHQPDEYTEWDDVVCGANVLLHTILATAEQPDMLNAALKP